MVAMDTINGWAAAWADFMVAGLVDSSVLLAILCSVWLVVRRWASAAFGYWLFLLVLVRLVLPFAVPFPPLGRVLITNGYGRALVDCRRRGVAAAFSL